MRKLPDSEVKNRSESLKKRHRSEWAILVYEASIGRTMQEVADLMERARSWVQEMLKYYSMLDTTQGGSYTTPSSSFSQQDIREVHKKFAPEEPNQEYVDEYVVLGHTPAVARCLATSQEATEKAIEAGVIQGEEGEREVVLPPGTEWELALNHLCSNVRMAAQSLDRAKIGDLRRAATRKRVAQPHAKWMEQVERLKKNALGMGSTSHKAREPMHTLLSALAERSDEPSFVNSLDVLCAFSAIFQKRGEPTK